jgi:23S rRNA pseudouridine1911/1915/1917 synthase
MVVHPDMETMTLVHALAYHFDNCNEQQWATRTGASYWQRYPGLLVIAKTEVAMSHLAKQFEAKHPKGSMWRLWGNVVPPSQERLK